MAITTPTVSYQQAIQNANNANYSSPEERARVLANINSFYGQNQNGALPSTIDSNHLANNTPPNIPTYPNLVGSYVPTNYAKGSLLTLSENEKNALNLTEKNAFGSVDLYSQLLGESADRTAALNSAGVNKFRTQLQDYNNQILTKTAELQQSDAQSEQFQKNIESQPVPLGVVVGQQAEQRRQYAIDRASKVAEIQMTNALTLSAQGNLQLAKDMAEEAVDAKYAPIREQIAVYEAQNKALEPILNNAERKIQAKQQMEIDAYKQNLSFMQDVKKTYLEYALKNNPNMAGSILNAKSLADIAKLNENAFNNSTVPSEKIESLNGTMQLLNDLEKSKGLDTRVGTTGFTRKATNFWGRVGTGLAGAAAGFAAGSVLPGIGNVIGAIGGFGAGFFKGVVDDISGAGQAFAGSVHQLTSRATLDQLINLKAQGGTLGALSDGERMALQNAATKLNDWEVKDKNGTGKGIWNIDEASFRAELNRIKTLTSTAIQRAGGNPTLSQQDISEVNALLNTSGAFNPASYYMQ